MSKIRMHFFAMACAALCFVWTCSSRAENHSTSQAQTPAYSESVLYNFCAAPGCTDGEMPSFGSLILSGDGNFYGVTPSGGNNNVAQCGTYGCGIVFRLSPAGAYSVLYSFCSQPNCSDGVFPSSLIEGTDGNFYGVTEQGGANIFQGCGASGCGAGTIFRLTHQGVLTTLYSFCNQADCTDGIAPNAPPLQGSDGNFYGTTLGGGTSGCDGNGCGTVYKLTPAGTLTTLYRFCNTANCADGIAPFAALVEGPDGNFYGTTSGLGSGTSSNTSGQTAFKITPTGNLTTLYTFCSQANCTDGRGPSSTLVLASDGNFYGTTNLGGANSSECNGYGCGTVYKISQWGVFSSLYSFCDASDCTLGNQPQSGLIQASDGYFYGAGSSSANLSGPGNIYKLSFSGDASLVYTFCSQTNCTDGLSPTTTLIQSADGNLYGMTMYGPEFQLSPNCPVNLVDGCGTVFEISPLPAPISATTGPVQMSLSQPAIELGSSVTLSWAVSNAFSQTMQQCNAFVQGGASGAGVWTGPQGGTLGGGFYSGEATLTPVALGTYTYALTCGGIESGFVTLTVGAPSLSVTTTVLPNGTVGQSYSTALAATGGVAPYTWTISSGILPQGLSLSGSTGVISGTPTEPGTSNFVVQVADAESTPMTVSAGLTITIPAPPPVVAASTNSATISVAGPGQSGTAVLKVSNFLSNNISFSCSGLPSGASCSFSNLTGSGSSGTVTMTVVTTAPSSNMAGQSARLAAFSLPGILLIAALTRKKRRDLYLFALVVVMGVALNGCGGGGSGNNTGQAGNANPGTPSGTASVTVTAVSGSQSAQMTLTLSVQ